MMTRDVFNREPRYFKAAGESYKLEFIPAEHFNAFMTQALTLAVKFQATGGLTVDLDKGSAKINTDLFKALEEVLRGVLQNQLYELIADVIQYQNDGANTQGVTAPYLRKRLSLVEMAEFIGLIMADDEILDAMEAFVKRAGELMARLPGRWEAIKGTLSAGEASTTPKSARSSSKNLA